MSYGIGDKVVYPMHGAGIIVSIEEREVLGEIAKYYDVEFPYGNLRLMVPMANTEQLGIRDVMSADKIPQVIEHIKKADGENMNQNWNKRQRENLEKIRSGNIFEVAEV